MKKANSNYNISSDINKSLSNENTADKIHADNIEEENAIKILFLQMKISVLP